MRVLKVKKEQEQEKVGRTVGARSYEEMIELAMKDEMEVGSLSEKEIAVLVDSLLEDDEKAKALAKRVSAGKAVLLKYGEAKDVRELNGISGVAKISDSTNWLLKPSKAVKILEKNNKIHLFDTIFSVSVTEFRKYLGSDLFEKSAEKISKTFASVSLKRK